MALDYGFLKESKWQPPIWCRLFGHKLLETKYEINIFPFLKSPLFICERCKMGQWVELDGKKWTTPEQVEAFLLHKELKPAENVISIRAKETAPNLPKGTA